MNASSHLLHILAVPTLMLIALFAISYCQVTLAQLEIPEAKPVENNGANSMNASDTSDYLVFDDPAMGYQISYPDDWEVEAPDIPYGLSVFRAPDMSAVTVKFIPADDVDSDSIEEYAEWYGESGTTQVTQSYLNSTTTLGGLPAYIETGVYTFVPNMVETLEGETGFTNRAYTIWGHSQDRDGFYGILFGAASKAQYDETLPVVKNMINSFIVEDTGQMIQENAEEDDTEEPDDTFVGSAENSEENEEQEND